MTGSAGKPEGASSQRFRFGRRSISRNLSLSLLFILILVEGILLAFVYRMESNSMLRQIQVRADDYITNLGQVLAVPIWNFDDEQIEKIGSGFAKYDLVNEISIYDDSGKQLFHAGRQPETEKSIQRSVPIVYDGQIIGRAKLSVSLKSYTRGLFWLRNVLVLVLAGSFAVILIVTGVLLRVLMRKPLGILEQRMDRIARGDFDDTTGTIDYRELAGIARRFGQMAVQIQARERALQKVNRELEEEIAERKRIEAALRRSEERYRHFFQEDLSGAYISKPDGRLITCNPVFAGIFGFSSPEQAMETNLWSLYLHGADRDRFLSSLKTRRKLEQYESTLTNLDGDRIHIIENAVGVFDDGNELTEIRGYIIDVTRQKNLEMQLRQALKMEAVGTLAGGIAHDFNNLLMGIAGNISLMLNEIDPQHPFYERLQQIEKNVQSGAHLTAQLLGYARKGRYQVKPLDLNRLVIETSDTFARTRREIVIHRDLDDDLAPIEADQGQVEQALLNLFVNAADAMPGGGKLYLRTKNISPAEIRQRIYAGKPGSYVMLSIADTGIGMDKNTRERIFDPFFTTKDMGRGTGLGLASVYGIVKGHGGYIQVDSRKGRGTTFTLYFPASARSTTEKTHQVDATPVTGTETILIVDDETIVLEVAEKMLQALGYTVHAADCGKKAIEIFRRHRDTVDLVILDMIMPDLSGSETFDLLKSIEPGIRVLLSSGYSIDGQARRILERGCDGFIQKPFNLAVLSAKIRSILEQS
jgi:PAS domain S-box-containing protein